MTNFLGALLAIGMVVLFVVAWMKIFVKAGQSAFMGLLMIVPLVNFIVFLSFAFAEWPIHVQMRNLAQSNTSSNSAPLENTAIAP
jgi:hypothetical protein